MSGYRFTALPSHSSVGFLVTALASAWFLVASGVILSESRATGANGAGAASVVSAPSESCPSDALLASQPHARATL